MIIRIEDIQEPCSNIVPAVDSSELSQLSETLELYVENGFLCMNVTNREYYAQVKIKTDESEDFHATVNAGKFLKLISQTTSDTVELKTSDNFLLIKSNGNYKLPMIFDNDQLLSLPKIEVDNVTSEFDIDSNILTNILLNNSKQLTIGTISKPVQKMYYLDNMGAITFTSGACVNEFNLPGTFKLLFNQRLVRLFKLFKDKKVHFTMGHHELANGIIQTRVKFECDDITLSAILNNDDSLINSVPVDTIRGLVSKIYPYAVNLNKYQLLESINRLMIFSDNTAVANYAKFKFGVDGLDMFDNKEENKESIYYSNEANLTEEYVARVDLTDLKATLDSCPDQHVTLHFGDNRVILLRRSNVTFVIPEVHE